VDKVAIVTGGTYGIGRGITLTLARKGFRVLAFGLDSRQVGSVAENGSAGTRAALEREGLTAELLEADVSRDEDVERVVKHALDTFGRIDGLVNNAAIHPRGTILDTPRQLWDQVLAVNLTGMYLMTRSVLPHMIRQGGGAIVNIASKATWGQPELLAYSASKGGVLGFTFALGYDHLQEHIRVNAVVPSSVESGMSEGRLTSSHAAQTVTGRLTQPADVASAVAFLLSDEAEQISGAVLNVNSFAGPGGPIRQVKPTQPAGA
jgi:NAD(P)-dependent dehydrogenase (short-subunit alcohol dehydrogenase family)